jgi:hypothetical protein
MQTEYVIPHQSVPVVELPETLAHLIGREYGQPAPGARVSVDVDLDITQRFFRESDVVKYIEEVQCVDWNQFGYVTVIEHSDGRQVLIDGQHRTGVVRALLPNQQEIPAHIIRTDDQKYAAKLFARLNGVTIRKISNEELLWAEVLAESPEALKTHYWLVECDLACGRVNDDGRRAEVKRATFERAIKYSPQATKAAVNLIRGAYPAARKFDNLLLGMVRLLSHSQYAKLMNKNITIGQMFEQWMNYYGQGHKISELVDLVPRTDPWYDAIAFGLYKQFRIWMDGRGKLHHCPSMDTLKKYYKLEV